MFIFIVIYRSTGYYGPTDITSKILCNYCVFVSYFNESQVHCANLSNRDGDNSHIRINSKYNGKLYLDVIVVFIRNSFQWTFRSNRYE